MNKKTFFLIVVCAFLFSCSKSPEDRAKKLIETELKETLHDLSSYESIKFGSLDSLFTSVLENKDYIEAVENYDKYFAEAKKQVEEVKSYSKYSSLYAEMEYAKKLAQKNIDLATEYFELYTRIDSLFVPEFAGWSMSHSFRSNNAGGNKIIGHYKYIFDKDITKIISSVDISK